MTVETTAQSAPTDARTIENVAADWFGRRQFWAWSNEDQARLDTWLAESLAHQVAYWRLAAAWDRTERLNAVSAPMRAQLDQDRAQRSWPKISLMLAGAAAVLAVAIVGVQKSSLLGQRSEIYSTAVGEMKTITLADGSSIELNTDTVLKANLRGNARAVRLEKGEAYFQVKHDAARPFTVAVGKHLVTDLGTEFLVRDSKNTVQVSLIEGSAQLDATDGANAHSVVLTPGDVAIASVNSLTISRKPARSLSERLGWREGVLIFDNTTLGEAAAEFNRYNRVQLVIANPSIARITVAGKFPTSGVDRFADLIEHVFGLRVQDRGGAMIISR